MAVTEDLSKTAFARVHLHVARKVFLMTCDGYSIKIKMRRTHVTAQEMNNSLRSMMSATFALKICSKLSAIFKMKLCSLNRRTYCGTNLKRKCSIYHGTEGAPYKPRHYFFKDL